MMIDICVFTFLPSATKLRRLCFYRSVSVHRVVSTSVHAGIPPPGCRPPRSDTPRADTLPGADTPPPEQTPSRSDTHPKKNFCFFLHLHFFAFFAFFPSFSYFCLFCIFLHFFLHSPQDTVQEMATAADGTHPTGMHSCFIEFVELGKALSGTALM